MARGVRTWLHFQRRYFLPVLPSAYIDVVTEEFINDAFFAE